MRPYERIDVEGGHTVPGAQQVGLIAIHPQDADSKYLAQLSRYGPGTSLGFQFATASPAVIPSGDTVSANVVAAPGTQTWAEIINTADTAQAVAVRLFDHDGNLRMEETLQLRPRAQQHLELSRFLTEQESGAVRVTPQFPNSSISQVVTYARNADLSLDSLYPLRLRRTFQEENFGSYNTFLGLQNELRLFNPNDVPMTASILFSTRRANENVPLAEWEIRLEPKAAHKYDLNSTPDLTLPPDSYGTVSIRSANKMNAVAEIIRRKTADSFLGRETDIEFEMPIEAR